MNGAEGNRVTSSVLIPWVAALLGFGFQIIWFSSQFGSLSARIEDAERRVALIEQNGSPIVQGLRTEVTINGRRIGTLEDMYNSKVNGVLTETAADNERLNRVARDVDALRQWQVTHIHDDGGADERITGLEREVRELEAEVRTLTGNFISAPHAAPRP